MNHFVDLHIHSYYSDGTMSPRQIIDSAKKAGVGIISITDHNEIDGSIEVRNIVTQNDIFCIAGVELDAVDEDINYHILAYGVDFKNKEFRDNVNHNKELLEEVNTKLILKMENENIGVSFDEYVDFSYNRNLGGWKALHYFMYKGLTQSLSDGYSLYAEYNHSYTCVNFPSIEEVCSWIHHAGGKAILAHPGKVIRESNLKKFSDRLNLLADFGLDGIECYYPCHDKEITDACIRVCKERKLLITSGADCHGSFEDTEIGQMKTTREHLDIECLL